MAAHTVLPTVQQLLQKLSLKPHPEGGFFAETYRASAKVAAPYGTRDACTAIHFLVTQGSVSRLHRIQADETWHFYLGGPLVVVELDSSALGNARTTLLGQTIMEGEVVQHTVSIAPS